MGTKKFNEVARRSIVHDFKGKQQNCKLNAVFDREPMPMIVNIHKYCAKPLYGEIDRRESEWICDLEYVLLRSALKFLCIYFIAIFILFNQLLSHQEIYFY